MIATKENKVTIEEFFNLVDWNMKSDAYWKEVIRLLENSTGWGTSNSVISDKVYDHPLMQQVKFVPYYKDGNLHLSEAKRIGKYIRRILYIKRGNSIPEYEYKDKK